jgi:hypothetical protein
VSLRFYGENNKKKVYFEYCGKFIDTISSPALPVNKEFAVPHRENCRRKGFLPEIRRKPVGDRAM